MAIVGAGLAGLACAHELERLGIAPVIFERQQAVGKPHLVMEVMAQFFHHHPRQDIFDHIRQDLDLPLKPHNQIQSVVMHSPRHTAAIHGHLGYSSVRGHDDRSLERQLARRIASEIRFGEQPDLWELRRQFDWVVVGTGNHTWTAEFTRWTPHITWSMRWAIATGAFDPAEVHVFFHPRYAATGYAMTIPIDERLAVAGVAVPQAEHGELERCWEAFRQGEGRRWDRELQHDRVDHMSFGQPAACIVGNVMLVGHAGGFFEPLFVAGQCPSLTSGVLAARQIALGDRSLVRFARRYRVYYNQLWRLRRSVNAWTEREMDRLVRSIHYTSGLLPHLPFNVIGLASWTTDALRLADDISPEVGPQ